MSGSISETMAGVWEWLLETGWPTHVQDEAVANAVYEQWLRDTHDTWVNGGYRDREPLGDALVAALEKIHGAADVTNIVLMLLLFLECRARREGNNRRVTERQ